MQRLIAEKFALQQRPVPGGNPNNLTDRADGVILLCRRERGWNIASAPSCKITTQKKPGGLRLRARLRMRLRFSAGSGAEAAEDRT